MKPVLLQLTSGYLSRILILLAVYFFLKGHNNPGGGFIAGLMIASSIMLHMLAFGTKESRKVLPCSPLILVVCGMFTALISGILPILFGLPFFTALWIPEFSVPLIGAVHAGTPMLFDLGVLVSVVGFAVSVIFDLENTE